MPFPDELTTKEWVSVVDQCVNLGAFHVTINGGEPMYRRDFWEIVGYFEQEGLYWRIFPNGSLIQEEDIEGFAVSEYF